jgi:cyclohexa-1,5-dienecarbonyl-CoA hydratase
MRITGDSTRLTLRRAPLNFLNIELLQQIQQRMESLGESPSSRALVIDSEGAAFSAGLEMSEQTKASVFQLLDQYHAVVHAITSFPRPTIAVVRGVALGAGNELAASCDFVIASHVATFGQPEIKVGSMPSLAPLLLPLRIGTQRAMHMILTGSPVDALEAEKIGLIYRAVSEETIESALAELIGSLCDSPVPVMELALRCARGSRLRELETNLREVQSIYLNEMMELEEPVEGVRAFMEKRAPRWHSR